MKLNIKKIILLVCTTSLVLPIWLDALFIPHKANTLALSSAGIAGNVDAAINPASLNYINPYIGMSSNKGYIDASGSKSTWVFGKNVNRYISVESFGVDDIPIQLDNDGIPDGYTSTNWLAFDFGSAISVSKSENFNMGYNFKLNYIKLDTERYWGYTFDLGLKKKINQRFEVGFVLKNLGQEHSIANKINLDDYSYAGLGFGYNTKTFKRNNFHINTELYIDYIYTKQNDIFKLAIDTAFPYVNLMLGSTYINGEQEFNDFSYGLSFRFKNWMVLFGNSIHENAAIGSPTSFEIRKYF